MSSGSSPRKANATYYSSYRSGDLDHRREAVVTDNPEIPVVNIDRFLELLFPPAPDVLDTVIQKLKDRGAINQDNMVAGFDGTNPSEESFFHDLHEFCVSANETTASVLTSSKGPKVEPTLRMVYKPSETPTGEKSNSSRPDSNWSRVAETGNSREEKKHKEKKHKEKNRSRWEDIVAAHEYKLDPKDRDDNIRKILWNAQQALRNDPRRMFFFGLTAEGTEARLWFFARSHIMVSSMFDFRKDYRPLLHFLISLSFCHVLGASGTTVDPSRPLEAHGYDPTIDRMDDEGHYRIFVGDVAYVTIDTLSDFRAESIRGRCTRVWRVRKELHPEEGEFALKEVWVDRRNGTEADIWKKLEKRMVASGKVDVQVIKDHFMPLVLSMPREQAILSCDFLQRGNLSAEASIAEFEKDYNGELLAVKPPPSEPKPTPATYKGSTRSGIEGAPYDDLRQFRPLNSHPHYIPRVRDRSVWGIVGKTYDRLTSLQQMIRSLEHILKALKAMWDGAYAIHRDISTGNIIIDKDGLARLADLEYVVFYDEDNNNISGVKTGTPEFMALEVSIGRFVFSYAVDPVVKPFGAHKKRKPNGTKFRHNPFHDVESVWRVLMWTVLRYLPAAPLPSLDKEMLGCKLRLYQDLFLPPYNGRLASLVGEYFDDLASFGNSELEEWCHTISNFLHGQYSRIERTFPITVEVLGDPHTFTQQCMAEISATLKREGIDDSVTVAAAVDASTQTFPAIMEHEAEH